MERVAPARKLGGRYVVEEHVATGGMASVWRARDEVLARTVALKVLRDDLARQADFRERFHREAVAAARLNHAAIVSIFDTGVDDVVYLVMEYFSGRTLADVLAERRVLDPAEAVDLMIPVLDALGYAHAQGIVHRDVKPPNILVGPGHQVKVADFGIAKLAFAGGDLTTTGKVLGTVRYLSPEQVEGGAVDARSDLYSAGVVLYELVTGRPPFSGESELATAMLRVTQAPLPPRAIVPGIPRDLEEIVMRALARDPDERFPSAEAMRAALERARVVRTATVGFTAPPPDGPATAAPHPPVQAGGSAFRSWMLLPLLLAAVAAIAIVGGLALGRLELGGPLGIRGVDGGGGDRAARISVSDARDYDPHGDDQAENPDDVGFAVDGEEGTSWSTDHYTTAAFGNLKPGLGVWLDLGKSVEVSRVTIRSPLPGWRFMLLPGPEPDEGAEPLAAEDGTTTFVMDGSGRMAIVLRPERIRGLMVWITQLAADEGGYAAEIAEIGLARPRQ